MWLGFSNKWINIKEYYYSLIWIINWNNTWFCWWNIYSFTFYCNLQNNNNNQFEKR